ncbi:MAG TPA: sulfite reductase subunit alpha, partial [Psychromonas sp.]
KVEETLEKGGFVATSQALVGSLQTANKYDKQNPFTATLLTQQKITGARSAKDVRHIEIDLEGSDLHYSAGDALGVWFENDPLLVDALIQKLQLDAQAQVKIDDKSVSLKEALTDSFELTGTHPAFVEGYAKLTGNKKLLALAEDKNKLRDFANTHQIIDVVSDTGNEALTAENFVALLRRISPRLYSIASSQAEVDQEVHLTVGTVTFENENGETRQGGASSFLGQRLQEGGQVKVFIEDNHNFRLPANPETPIIMVGPGTGIAPFRAFMQEREATDATGKNWLFFGDQTFTEDFLYQTEWQGFLKSGLLTKLDLAFSRDQAEKIYVQDRLKENAHEIYQWLQEGAHFYVCGDANRMAKDVQQTLIEIIGVQGNKSLEDAEQYLTELRQAKRYQRDVY